MKTLEVIIGLVFIFLLLSMLGTIIQEFVSTAFSLRGKVLLEGLVRLFEIDDQEKEKVKISRSAIKATNSYRKLRGKYFFNAISLLPSYLSSQQAIKIIQEAIQNQTYHGSQSTPHRSYTQTEKTEDLSGRPLHLSNLKSSIFDSQLSRSLEKICKSTDSSRPSPQLEFAKKEIQSSYTQLMESASEWYKRRIQFALLLIGFGISVLFNADAFQIYQQLSNNSQDRNGLLSLVDQYVEVAPEVSSPTLAFVADSTALDSAPQTKISANNQRLRSLLDSMIVSGIQETYSPLGLGWNQPTCQHPSDKEQGHFWCYVRYVLDKIPGWIITAFAISLGAPFWFDFLNRFVNIRAARKPTEEQKPTPVPRPVFPTPTPPVKKEDPNQEEKKSPPAPPIFVPLPDPPVPTPPPPPVPPTPPNILVPNAIHLRGNNPNANRANGQNQAHPLAEVFMPTLAPTLSESDRRAALLTILDWLEVENPAHRRYQPREGKTYCNIYTYDFCFLTNAYLPRVWWKKNALRDFRRGINPVPKYGATLHELNANALYNWLEEFGSQFGWKKIEQDSTGHFLTEVQEDHANQGRTCVICAQRTQLSRSGHIAVIAPESERHQAERNNGRVTHPLQSQAGQKNLQYFTRSRLNSDQNWWERSGINGFQKVGFWVHMA